ncbi:MAG: hypothetical protein GXY33_12430 [Phycisphaerae bacterium]|nr:hypothetical protein [Phycisphaerae bacterium]
MNKVLCAAIVLLATGIGSAVTFRNIGPGGGGTMGAMAVDPSNPDVVYAGLDCGGLHVTTDGGKSWANANAGIGTAGETAGNCVNAIVVLPTGRAVVGTDRGQICVSDDHGRSWTKAAEKLGALNLLVVDPKEPRTVYAANSMHYEWRPADFELKTFAPPADGKAAFGPRVYVSRESGEPGSWKVLNTSEERNIPPDAHVLGLAVDREDTALMYATTDYGLYRSVDGGVRWESIQAGLGESRARKVLTVAGKPKVVYATVGGGTLRPGVYRSDDAGATWTGAYEGIPEDPHLFALAVDPVNPQVIYAGSREWCRPLYRSTDGGASWAIVMSPEMVDPAVNAIWHGDRNHTSVGCDICPAGVDGDKDGLSDVIYAASDNLGDIKKSSDNGKTWRQIVSDRKVIDGHEFWSGRGEIELLCSRRIVVDPRDPNHLWLSYYDWGLFESVDGGKSMRLAFGPWVAAELIGSTRGVALDPDNPDIVYCGNAYGGTGEGGVLTNLNGQGWWIIGGRKKYAAALPNSAVLDVAIVKWQEGEQAQKYLYATSGQHGVYRMDFQKFDDFRKVADGLPKEGKLVFNFMTACRGALPLYVATDDGLFRSDDGSTWKSLAAQGLPQGAARHVICLVPDPADSRRVYATVMRGFRTDPIEGVYLSEDGGEKWSRIAHVPVPFEMDLDASGERPVLYVASQCDGVYRVALDAEGKWQASRYGDKSNGLDGLRVWGVTVDPHNPKRIYAGTHGTGVFVGE